MEQTTNTVYRINSIFFVIIFLILFFYVCLRAYFVGFTHDESLTFTIINGDRFWLLTANNHWLNTILSYLSGKLFGFSELALRLPNVLAYLLYGYFSFNLVVKESKTIVPALIAAIFLLLNPYMIEFFSLSRGYGLAMALFSGCLYYFMKASDCTEENHWLLFKGIICALLTIYANYAFVIPVIAAQAAYFVCRFNEEGRRFFNKQRMVLFSAELLLLLPTLANIIVLKLRKQLYFGGTKDIIHDTVFSFFRVTFQVEYVSYQKWIIIAVLLAAISYSFWSVWNKKDIKLLYILIVFVICLLLPIILHYTLGMKYPKGRAALYWVIIIGVFLFLFLENVFETNLTVSSLFQLIFSCVNIVVVVGLFNALNFEYARSWKGDADIRSMLDILGQEVETARSNCNLRISPYYEPVINYYRITKNLDWLEPVTRKVKNDVNYDYLYITKNKEIPMNKIRKIKDFKNSGSTLIKILRSNGCCPEIK